MVSNRLEQFQRKYSTVLVTLAVILVSTVTYYYTRSAIRTDRKRFIQGVASEISDRLATTLAATVEDIKSVKDVGSFVSGPKSFGPYLRANFSTSK
jgi:hypothetical protein